MKMPNRRSKTTNKGFLAFLAILFLAACNEPREGNGTASLVGATNNVAAEKSRVLQIRMHDLPIDGEDVEKVIIGIQRIEAHHTEKGWVQLPFEPRQYDLLELQNGTSVVVFESPIEVGKYTQLRLLLNQENQIIIRGAPFPLEIPSGDETGVKLVTPFEIKDRRIVEVTLYFNIEQSVKIVDEKGRLRPVIKVDGIAEYDGAAVITPAGGYLSSIHGDFNIVVPPNATSETIVFSMRQVDPSTITAPLPEGAALVGRVYDLGPEGYPFSANITLEIPYDEAIIDRLGEEGDLFVVTYNEQLKAWEPVPSTIITSANVVRADVSHFSIYALAMKVTVPLVGGIWRGEYGEGTVALINDTIGRITISKDGTVNSVIRTTVLSQAINATLAAGQMAYRPTLFVSIGGAVSATVDSTDDIDDLLDGSGTWKWQSDLQAVLFNKLAGQYEYKHFAVDLDSHASNLTQVFELSDVIKDFLNARQYAWDVVLIGHSRGGVFAHELTRELVGHGKIKNLHTFLLDPTASGAMNDSYPAEKYDAYPTAHYGTLFYDGLPWLELSFRGVNWDDSTGTIGDIDIRGYTNYGRHDHLMPNTSHPEIPSDWIERTDNQGLTKALAEILAVKDFGAFDREFVANTMEYVRVTRPAESSFEGDIDFRDGELRIWGEVTLLGMPATIDATFAPDGLQVGNSVGIVGGTQAVVTDERVVASDSLLVTSTYTSIGN